MKQIPVDLEELAFAFDDGSPEHEYFLDLETGEVLLVAEELGFIEARQERERIAEHVERYLPVPQLGATVASGDMDAFVETVADDRLQELLDVALDGQGACRRFRDALDRYPAERDRWHAFRHERLMARVRAWLAEEEIERLGKA